MKILVRTQIFADNRRFKKRNTGLTGQHSELPLKAVFILDSEFWLLYSNLRSSASKKYLFRKAYPPLGKETHAFRLLPQTGARYRRGENRPPDQHAGPVGGRVDLNPFDIVALEQALRLKERYGGRVTAISMGPPQAEQVLREALSLGADEGILLSDRPFAGADTLATSYTLGKAIEKLDRDHPVDLILCGKQAIDGDTGQTGPGLATRLGYTQLTYVVEVEWIDESKRQIQVKRKVEGGRKSSVGPCQPC